MRKVLQFRCLEADAHEPDLTGVIDFYVLQQEYFIESKEIILVK